jgi:hypothetical protein
MDYLNHAEVVLRELQDRRHAAERLFTHICRQTPLVRWFGEAHWGIVGGAVRDVMLASERANQDDDWSWPDLDIAVLGPVDELPIAVDPRLREHVSLSRNSFGGWKIEDEQLGEVDVWSWPSDGVGWEAVLQRVDFGLNALAFTWPARQIVLHPRWAEDVSRGWVEKVHPSPPRPELQAVRASALAEKLTRLLDMPIAFGPGVQQEVDWLVHGADEQTKIEAMRYFAHKLQSGRWRKDALRFFHRACDGCGQDARDLEGILEALTGPLSAP